MSQQQTERFPLFMVSVALLTGILVLRFLLEPLALNVDSAYAMEIGRHLLAGAVPYLDYYEINPPLIFWLSTIPVIAGEILNINEIIIFKLITYALVFASAAISYRMLRQSTLSQRVPLFAIIPVMILLGTVLTYSDIGERDHWIVLGLIPYLILRTKRYESEEVSRTTAILIGGFAALSMALRPHYILVIAIVEVYYLVRYRLLQHIFRAETITTLICGGLYAAYMASLPAEAWMALNEQIPYIAANYQAMAVYPENTTLLMSVRFFHSLFILFTGILFYLWLPDDYHTSLMFPLMIFATGAYAVYLSQRMGFPYHGIPLVFSAMIVFTGILSLYYNYLTDDTIPAKHKPVRRILVAVYAITGITLIVLIAIVSGVFSPVSARTDVANLIAANSSEGDQVYFIDTDLFPAYPTLTQLNRRNSFNYQSAGIIAFETYNHPDPTQYYGEVPLPARTQTYLDSITEDIATYMPSLILVKREDCWGCSDDFDLHRLLETNDFIDTVLLPDYEALENALLEDFVVYKRQ